MNRFDATVFGSCARVLGGVPGMKFVDAHIHLSDPEYELTVNGMIGDAKRSGVAALVSNSMDLRTSLGSLELASKYPGVVFAALGIHPWTVRRLPPNEMQAVTDLITRSSEGGERRVVAIGEVGLDFTYVRSADAKNLQRRVFNEMLSLAEKLSLPVIVHSRGTAVQIAEILTSYRLRGVLFHWFSSPIGLLPKLIDCGYYITEGPPVLYSRRVRENVMRVPLNRLLTETDGPVRFRGPFEGKVTSPSFIPIVVEEIAKLKKLSTTEVAERIAMNFVEFFGVKLL